MRTAARTLALAALLALAPAAAPAAKNPIAGTGTILHLGPAANAYAIQADNGAIYEPTNLAKKYRQDGLRVSFKAKPDGKRKPIVSGAQPVRIAHIAILPDAPPTPRTRTPRIPSSR